MKRRIALLCLLTLCCCMTFVFAVPTAQADMGPHPAVSVDFRNLGEKKMYATLLSEDDSTGPNHAYLPNSEYFRFKEATWTTPDGKSHNYNEDVDPKYNVDYTSETDAIWQKFYDYSQTDGYYFLQTWWEFDGDPASFDWGYYAPQNFKLLLYFPEHDVFVCSDACRSYTVHGYYTVDLLDIVSQLNGDASELTDLVIQPQNSYDYLGEALGLAFRIVATILVELLVALLFRLETYRQITTIIYANLATQTLLNVILNLASFFGASIMFVFLIIPMELVVFEVEATVYAIVFRRQSVPVWKSILYAFVANLVSVLLGVGLSALFPFLF